MNELLKEITVQNKLKSCGALKSTTRNAPLSTYKTKQIKKTTPRCLAKNIPNKLIGPKVNTMYKRLSFFYSSGNSSMNVP